jgi:hypothetical protein
MISNSPPNKSSLINHKLHIFLSIISFGGWLPIYAAYYLFRKLKGSNVDVKNVLSQVVKSVYFKTKKLNTKQKISIGAILLIMGLVGTFTDDNSVTDKQISAPTPTPTPTPTPKPTPKPTPTPTLNNETKAGTEVIISDIKNRSDFDGVSWYWAAEFKTNTEFLTKTDCVVKALNENGEVVGETSFRGMTRRDGTVNGGAKTSVDTTKAKALSIKNFDIRCTIAAAPEGEATFSISISGWQVVNPASGYAIFTIRNSGEIAGEPICRIIVEDESGTYKGTGFVIGVGAIEPGAKYQGKKLLTIKKQGAFYVSQSRGYCN